MMIFHYSPQIIWIILKTKIIYCTTYISVGVSDFCDLALKFVDIFVHKFMEYQCALDTREIERMNKYNGLVDFRSALFICMPHDLAFS